MKWSFRHYSSKYLTIAIPFFITIICLISFADVTIMQYNLDKLIKIKHLYILYSYI